jgi:hypothetical protein
MDVSRRTFLRAGLAAGVTLAARPALSRVFQPFGLAPFETARASRLFDDGTFVAHADLHNHSLHSDGDGDPALAFGLLRDAGLDVAALTDHSTLSWGIPQNYCPDSDCQSLAGINDQTWAEAKVLSDAANAAGSFVALRGFEWSSPTIGHMNVWFSESWMDPLHTGGGGTGEGAAQFAHDEASFPAEQMAVLDEIVRAAPTTGAGMALFYEWLAADPSRPIWGGGADGLAQFNHPGREPGRFSNFQTLPGIPDVRDRVVAIEMFNRREDYIYEGTEGIAQSPLNECLNAGWRVGISGVTDEHGTDWGTPLGKGRTGLWVAELSQAGVKEALANRRFFATRERGLRVDASANGTRMGGSLASVAGPVTFVLDVDGGTSWHGRELLVQVLRRGPKMPSVQATLPFTVPTPDEPVVSFSLDVDPADGDWIVLRITDPAQPADGRADATWASFGNGVAYCSPFFLAGSAY